MNPTPPPPSGRRPADLPVTSATSSAPDLRVGDQDRARVTALLAEHYASGRLDLAELDERSTLALGAVRRRELDALLADLPDLGTAPGAEAVVPSARRRPRAPVVALALLAVAIVVATQGAALWFLPMLWWVLGAGRHRRQAHRPTSDPRGSMTG